MTVNHETRIQLLADHVNGKPVYESVPAVPLGAQRFRLAASPGFAPGAASGDEIELTPGEKPGFQVLKRSGNVCIQLFLRGYSPSERDQMVGMMETIGGWLDGGTDGKAGHLLIFTVPVAAGFSRMEAVMHEIHNRFSVDRWMYGNVYDVRDGTTPLNWWIE